MIENKKVFKNPLIRKFIYAFFGLKTSIKEEKSLVIHIIIAILTIIISGVLRISITNWCIVILLIGFVISFELINTCIENTLDLVSFKFNFNVKKIKDICAAATLIIAIIALIVGLLIFIPRIIELAKHGYYWNG